MSYLLSIVIPTKDRYKYLKGCLKSIVSLKSSDIEIVVQDNTIDNNEINSFIKELNWPHIKYYHETSRLSQSENSELAVGNSTGTYICYIGDDDTITEQMIEVVKWAEYNKVDSCNFPAAVYNWPDVVFKFYKFPTLSFYKNKFYVKKLNAKNELIQCLKQGATTLTRMPKVYHGIVAKRVLDEVYNLTGCYFPGPSPDMANATALSLIVKKHYWINIPLMVDGFSYKSAGGKGLRGEHKAKLSDVAQLPLDTEEKWERTIPKVWLAATIWAESCSKALRAMDQEEFIKKINWSYTYAKITVNNPEYYSDVKPYINNISKKLKTFFWIMLLFSKRGYNFILNFFRNKLKITKRESYHNEMSIIEAMNIINKNNSSVKQFRSLR